MDGTDGDKVLDPMGDTVQGLVRGKRGAGRLEVTVLWPQIEKALDAGVPVKTIWQALSQNGLVSIKRRGFAREVKSRREGAGGLGTAARLAAEPQAPTEKAPAGGAPSPAASASAGADGLEPAERRPGLPDRPWRRGPREAPDPNFVFKPRDPLADD